MKTCEQMAADVLSRSQIYMNRQKRNRRIAAGVSAFGCMTLLIAANVFPYLSAKKGDSPSLGQPPVVIGSHPVEDSKGEQNTQTPSVESIPPWESTPNGNTQQNFKVVLLMATSPNDPGTELVEDLTLPMKYTLRVRDLRGISDLERLQAELEERELHKAMMDEVGDGASMILGNCTNRENYMISFVRTGCFRLWIKDRTAVERISIKSTTNYGKIDVSLSNNTFPKGHEVSLLPEDIPEWDWKHGLRVNWKYSDALLEALDENPSRPLSEFSDLLVFTVEFSDGSVEESKVELLILDNGEVMARLLSIPTVNQ